MSKKILIVLRWINCFLLLGSLVVMYELTQYKGSDAYLRCLFLLLPIISTYILIQYAKKFWMYCLLSILLVLASLFFGATLEEQVIFIGLTIIICVKRFLQKLRRGYSSLEEPTPYLLIYFIFLYTIAHFIPIVGLKSIIYYHTGLYLLIYIAYTSLSSTDAYLAESQNIKNVPMRRIKSINNIFLSIVLGLSSLAIVVVPVGSFDKLFSFIKSIFIAILRFIVNILSFFSDDTILEETEMLEETVSDMADVYLPEAAQTPDWLLIIYKVLDVIMRAALIIGALVVVFLILRWIYRRFYNVSDADGDIMESIASPHGRSNIKVPKRRERSNLRTYFTPDALIRRRYKKIIESASKEGPSDYDTPVELEERAGIGESKERDILHSYYEKARYSNQECSPEDARIVKEAAGKKVSFR